MRTPHLGRRIGILVATTALGLATSAATVAPVAAAAATSRAGAVPPTCRGLAPTLVGEPGEDVLRGTDDDDVIITNGVHTVRARDGDDVICTTRSGKGLDIQAGSGDDVVDRTEDQPYPARGNRGGAVVVALGSGVDRFEGVDGPELVYAGGGDTVLGNGAGSRQSFDHDEVYVGSSREPAVATVRLSGSSGNRVIFGAAPAPGLDLEVADGSSLELGRLAADSDWHVDLRHRSLVRDGVDLGRVAGFTSVQLRVGREGGPPVRLTGGPLDEQVSIDGMRRVSLDLGGGNDDLRLESGCRRHRLVAARGGPGRDHVSLSDYRYGCAEQPPSIDLREGEIRTGSRLFATVRGFPRATLTTNSPGAVLRGGKGDDILRHVGCGATLSGGGGDDRLSSRPPVLIGFSSDHYETCPAARRLRMVGGAGDDSFVRRGGANPSVMTGGAGRDVARGSKRKRDVCDTEVGSRCRPPTAHPGS